MNVVYINHVRGESNIDHGYRKRPLDVLGMGGQPMDVFFPISVAPINEHDEISLKSGPYQKGGALGVKK